MKKKGILLLGSLTLMVIAMVFIAVTLISRASVTPETSDAATPKKKDIVTTTSKNSSEIRYSLKQLEHKPGTESYVNFINDLGVVTGVEYIGYDYTGVVWDQNGNLIKTLSPLVVDSFPREINNSGQMIGTKWGVGADERQFAYTYDINTKVYKELETVPYSKTNFSKRVATQLKSKNLLQIKNSKYSQIRSSRYNSELFTTDDSSFNWTYAADINNQSDIVGGSNFKAILWSKGEKKTYKMIDLDAILKKYLKNDLYLSIALYVTDVKDGIIKIAGNLDYKDIPDNDLFVIDYSLNLNKEVSVKIINSSNINTANYAVSRGLNENGELLVAALGEMYIFIPKDNYTTSTKLSDVFAMNGYKIEPDYDGIFDDSNTIAGVMYWDERPFPYGDLYIVNMNSAKVEIVRHLVEKNQISGLAQGGQIIGILDFNKTGAMAVDVYSASGDNLTGILTPKGN